MRRVTRIEMGATSVITRLVCDLASQLPAEQLDSIDEDEEEDEQEQEDDGD